MSLKLMIKKSESLDGNYCRGNDDIYISSSNMDLFLEMLEKHNEMPNILITPYLIIEKSNTVYELHYYEFELENVDSQESCFVEHFEGNTLPDEIKRNIKPKGNVAEGDKEFYLMALQDYLMKIRKMEFLYDKENDERLKESSLYFQIF